MKNSIFINSEIENLWDKHGYVIIPTLFEEKQLQELDKIAAKFISEVNINYGFYASTFLPDTTLRKKYNDEIYTVYKDSLNKVFQHYKALGSVLIIKLPSEDSELELHQDTTLIDENVFQAVNTWTPLADVSNKNGGLGLIPGSQHFYNSLRHPTITYPFNNIKNHVSSHLQRLVMRRGDTLILDPTIIHQSNPNYSDKIRVAVDTAVTHKDASFLSVWKNPESNADLVDVYAQEDDYLLSVKNLRENVFEKPGLGTFVKQVEYKQKLWSESDFDALISKFTPKETAVYYDIHSATSGENYSG